MTAAEAAAERRVKEKGLKSSSAFSAAKTPLPPMEARSVDECRAAMPGNTNRNGTDSVVSPSATEATFSCNPRPASRWRYFPDVVRALRELKAKQFVLDGELVIPVDSALQGGKTPAPL
jgi:hypothetical protein